MDAIVGSLFIFISTLVGIIVLGLVAGFSPTLYIAQIAITSKAKKEKTYTAALTAGVLGAIILLVFLFQTLHLNTLLGIIDSTVRTLTVSVIFNMIVGIAFIASGIWYLRHEKTSKPKPILKRAGGFAGVFGLGFIQTFVSISGVTAIFIAGNIIANTSSTLAERLAYTALFLAAALAQFVVIILLMKKGPDRLTGIVDRLEKALHRFNYRPIIGVGVILLGASIVLFNVMMFLFY